MPAAGQIPGSDPALRLPCIETRYACNEGPACLRMPTPRSAISWPLKLNLAFSSSLGTDTRSVTLPGNWNPRLASVIMLRLASVIMLRLASVITVALGVSNHCCAWRQ
jgi:hypothetical protein